MMVEPVVKLVLIAVIFVFEKWHFYRKIKPSVGKWKE